MPMIFGSFILPDGQDGTGGGLELNVQKLADVAYWSTPINDSNGASTVSFDAGVFTQQAFDWNTVAQLRPRITATLGVNQWTRWVRNFDLSGVVSGEQSFIVDTPNNNNNPSGVLPRGSSDTIAAYLGSSGRFVVGSTTISGNIGYPTGGSAFYSINYRGVYGAIADESSIYMIGGDSSNSYFTKYTKNSSAIVAEYHAVAFAPSDGYIVYIGCDDNYVYGTYRDPVKGYMVIDRLTKDLAFVEQFDVPGKTSFGYTNALHAVVCDSEDNVYYINNTTSPDTIRIYNARDVAAGPIETHAIGGDGEYGHIIANRYLYMEAAGELWQILG